MSFFEFFALFVLFFLSASFSASEAAITTLSTLKMKQLAALRPALGRSLSEWLARPHRLLTAILVGNNAVNIAFSSLVAALALRLDGVIPPRLKDGIVWIVTTVVVLVGAEIVPKIVARSYAERISLLTLPFLHRFSRLFTPFFRPFRWILDRVGEGEGLAPVNRITAVSLEEMHHVLSESRAAGHMTDDSKEMMARVLSLHPRSAGEIFQPAAQVDAVSLDVLDAGPDAENLFVDLLVETGRTRVPVTRAGVPVGYIHVMDILKEWRPRRVPSLDALIRPGIWIPPEEKVFDLLERFRKTGHRLFFVEGANGEFLGLVTLEDLLEEIVGEILDEYDVENKK